MRTDFAKLMDRIDVREPHECWPWTGGLRTNGYPMFARKGSNGKWTKTTAARALYEECICDVPDDWEVDHICFNRACMNIEHLEAVTHEENLKRRNAAKTHCPHGHRYTDETTRWQKSKGVWGRVCRICENDRHRSYYHGKAVARRRKLKSPAKSGGHAIPKQKER